MDFTNSALVQEELFVQVAMVVEDGKPASPSFLNALSALSEALVLHERVYFDPFHISQRPELYPDLGATSLHNRMLASQFFQQLRRNEAIWPFPDLRDVRDYLSVIGSDFDLLQFAEAFGGGGQALIVSPEDEGVRYSALLPVIRGAPDVFVNDSLSYKLPITPTRFEELDPALQANQRAMGLGLGERDWALLTSFNRRVQHLQMFSQILGVKLYLSALALPHQIGGVRNLNRKAREIYETISEEVLAPESRLIGTTAFSRVSIPPLARVVIERSLSGSGDMPTRLAAVMAGLRHEHRAFRRALSDIERAVDGAEVLRELSEIENLFNNSFGTLLNKSRSPKYRLAYRYWELFRPVVEGRPGGAVGALVDRAVQGGRERYIIGRIGGMHDFYDSLQSAPVHRSTVRALRQLFPLAVNDEVWDLAGLFANEVNKQLIARNPLDSTRAS